MFKMNFRPLSAVFFREIYSARARKDVNVRLPTVSLFFENALGGKQNKKAC